MSSLNLKNGRSPENTPRTEAEQEKQGQDYLQLEARAPNGGTAREKRQYIICFENVSKFSKPFAIQEVTTVSELQQKICAENPRFCNENVGLRVSDSRMGTLHRIFYDDKLPTDKDTLYLSLYLKRHPPLAVGKN